MKEINVAGARDWSLRRGFNIALLGAALAFAGMSTPLQAKIIPNANAPALAPSIAVGVWTSQASESKDDFVRRVGATLTAYTKANKIEVCGHLMKSRHGEGWRLAMTTSRSHLGCIAVSMDDPDYMATPETVHTHPYIGSVHPSVEDVAIMPGRGFSVGGMRQYFQPEDFSNQDYASGPGYVIVPPTGPFGRAHVLHQTGPGTSMDLGAVVPSSIAPRDDMEDRWASMVDTHQESSLGVGPRRQNP